MPNLSWNEVRDRAIAFSRRWSDEDSEVGGKQTFWNEFFAVFGRDRRTVAAFEVAVKNLHGRYNHIDLLWRGMLLVEHKSRGKSLEAAESQAFAYIADLARAGRFDETPRYVMVSDFVSIALYDLDPDEQKDLPLFADKPYAHTTFALAELHRHTRQFGFIKGEQTLRLDPEDPANEKAYARMCQLHDELAQLGFTGTDLERLLVRLLFCLFADDTNVFEPATFETFIREQTREDGSDVGARLNELFEILDTPETRWSSTAKQAFAGFRYINGDLFRDRLRFPPFTRTSRAALLSASEFQWARVSPAVFGSLFQGIMEDTERRQQGAHYTSERDIMKVIRSLFLDDLRAELSAIQADSRKGHRKARLEEFHRKLRALRFLDPACGCGNFLVLGYRELRQLELEVLRLLYAEQQFLDIRQAILVDVDQFYGIEYAEWPTRIAEVAMWLMDHQMNQRASETFGKSFERLPLRSSPHIVQGNALRLDWKSILEPSNSVSVFVLGNPPFVGKKEQSAEQKADMEAVWEGVKGAGVLDYVTGWYRKAADYIAGTRIPVAFVSTNSITQGEQVGILWGELFGKHRLKIHFGHRTFAWTSEARGKAHVHVVIIGFGAHDAPRKRIYEYDPESGSTTITEVANISPYLVAAGDTTVRTRTTAINDAPAISYGSMMIDKDRKSGDESGLILTREHKDSLIAETPALAPYIRVLYGGEEFLNGTERWCLWLVDAPPNLVRASPLLHERIETVRRFRSESKRPQTQELARTPTLFGEIRQPSTPYLFIPKVSSERRTYIPIGFLPPEIIASGSALVVADATEYHFSILSSAMHNAWMRSVAGRMKSDFQYSNNIVYNNFPWPVTENAKQRSAVQLAAKAVLAAREPFLPPKGTSTLADLYDPLTTPPALAKAHSVLDRAVDRCYRSEPFRSDRERVEHLFALYERLTAPLLPESTEAAKRTRRRQTTSNGNSKSHVRKRGGA